MKKRKINVGSTLSELLSKHHGNIVINVFESGSQHVEKVECQYLGTLPDCPRPAPQESKASPQPSPKGREKGTGNLPEVLATNEAMALWDKVKKAGYVDDNFQPLISRTQSALLADAMAKRLGIREKWKVFETLWNRKNMYRDYYKALNLQQSLAIQDEIKKLLR